ncbi:hypothetical protein [Aureibacter tunicatorum]|uniref:Uncharacterized protein n=1 Tax=Aureibacter tunicatorum TaxID=866807 RepID=A0AAE4BTI2_9BACT|nr:hypothetical protein [Aureibacter tunicatorum]MDR6239965.1 hypothetical protein [Aureibacter tunicatorum]BDD04438.1 hypothetical protein AUTU_19210 [Aureibacter tunicatorum]
MLNYKEIEERVNKINNTFNNLHYIEKRNRKISTLYKILLYNSEIYKKNINEIQALYSTKKRKIHIKYRELVACSIAAKYEKSGVFGTSFGKLSHEDSINYKLRKQLNKLGIIGELSSKTSSKNIIGKCAENKAANKVLKIKSKAELLDIQFTKAIRPRTSEPIPRCENCEVVYGKEKI